MDPVTIRRLQEADTAAWAAWRARATTADCDAYDRVLALVGERGRTGTMDITRRFLIDVSWEAHVVRHALGAHDAVRWFVAVLVLERQGAVSVSRYTAPIDDAEWQQWQDRPLAVSGARYVTPAGVLTLAAAYERSTASLESEPFFCEECLCPMCAVPSATPGGGWCVACREAYGTRSEKGYL